MLCLFCLFSLYLSGCCLPCCSGKVLFKDLFWCGFWNVFAFVWICFPNQNRRLKLTKDNDLFLSWVRTIGFRDPKGSQVPDDVGATDSAKTWLWTWGETSPKHMCIYVSLIRDVCLDSFEALWDKFKESPSENPVLDQDFWAPPASVFSATSPPTHGFHCRGGSGPAGEEAYQVEVSDTKRSG